MRGLRNASKRAVVFSHLSSVDFSLCLLQEVHLKTVEDVKGFTKEWVKGDSRWSIGGVHSSGVGTLSGNVEVKIVGSFSVIQGRVLVTDVDWKGKSLRVVNIYAHAAPKERNELFLKLDTVFMTNRHVIVGGDFNSPSEGKNMGVNFHSLVKKYSLVDSFRSFNSDDPGFTWGNSRGARSRIDYIFCPLDFQVFEAQVSPVFYSDHNMLSVVLNLKVTCFGKGYWKLNNSILGARQFRVGFRSFFKECIKMKMFYGNVSGWWESTKVRIKHYIQVYSKESRKAEFKEYYQLQKSIENLMAQQNTGERIDEELLKRWQNEQRLFFHKRAEAYKFRSLDEKWEKDEKCSSYFFKQSKVRAKRRRIASLLNERGEEIDDPEGLVEIASGNYSKFFSAEIVDYSKGSLLLNNVDSSIPDYLKLELDKDIQLEEILKALQSLKKGKVPGVDGLTKEFYLVFWEDIGPQLLDLFTFICTSGIMGSTMREGVISLLYKKGDVRDISNYRPLTMLCTDYKIFSKILTNRLVSALEFIIGLDQTCAVQGRQIQWNLQMHRDVLAYSEDRNFPLIVLSLDQEKAFDRVNHKFLFRILERFGFGKRFRSWLKILYTEVGSRVNVNGNMGVLFKQTRGVRQGCPASAPLYVVFIEILACAIRKNAKIRGLPLPGGETLVISQFADDTVLYLENDFCLKEAINVIEVFSSASGSRINKGKSLIKYLGRWKDRNDKPYGLALCPGPMTLLGISFGNKDDVESNWEVRLAKVLSKLNMWKLRKLSFSGKVLAIKADILPALLHVACVFPMTAMICLKLQRMLFNFMWGGYEYIKREIMYQPIERGGKDMPNVRLKLNVIFFSNICKITMSPPKHKCHSLMKFWLAMHLRPLGVAWDNRSPKAEVMPLYYKGIISWAKKYKECWDSHLVLNHRKLYEELMARFNPRETVHIPSEVWKRTQFKQLDNQLKDFNWLVLHRRLAVRNTLFNHGLTRSKYCPREGCLGKETVEHALFECFFAQQIWEGLGKKFVSLRDMTWEGVLYMEFNMEREKLHKVVLLVSIVKYKLWEVRCDGLNGGSKWSVLGTIKSIEDSIERRYQLEIRKWGIDSIKDRWKMIYGNS